MNDLSTAEPAAVTHTLTVDELPIARVVPQSFIVRRYLPTLADLIDRMTIVQQKEIFIPEKRAEYIEEMELLQHDIDVILEQRAQTGNFVGAREIHAICVIMLANRYIWENETKIRDGSSEEDDATQLKRLKATHSINGVRNTAKNILSEVDCGRKDYKIDSLSADLPPEFGNWRIFFDRDQKTSQKIHSPQEQFEEKKD